MKKVLRVVALLLAVAALFCLAGCQVGDPVVNYHRSMEALDQSTANGTKIVGYDVDGMVYTYELVPENLLAQTPEEVGYILRIDRNYDESKKLYGNDSASKYIHGDHYYVELVDCDTGEVLAAQEFEPFFPFQVDSFTRAKPRDEDVTNWVTGTYQKIQGN